MSQNPNEANNIMIIEDNTSWTFNGITLTLDMMDAETTAHYEACVARMQANNAAKDGTGVETISTLCNMIRSFFDDLFGEGTGAQLIERNNMRVAMNCYNGFIKFVKDQSLDMRNALEAVSAYAGQNLNREGRRALAKNNQQ